MNSEPAVTLGAIVAAAVVLVLAVLIVAFGLDLNAIVAAVAILAPVVAGLIIRPKVTPVPKFRDNVDGPV